jgi:hypothetical protein
MWELTLTFPTVLNVINTAPFKYMREWSTTSECIVRITSQLICSGEGTSDAHCTGDRVGPRAGLKDSENRKFFTLFGLELRSLCRPARSELYRRSHSCSCSKCGLCLIRETILDEGRKDRCRNVNILFRNALSSVQFSYKLQTILALTLLSTKLRLTAVGTRCAHKATPLYLQKFAQNSLKIDDRSVGIFRLPNKIHRICFLCLFNHNQFYVSVRFEVFTAVTMKNGVFWDVTPCGSCNNRRFGGN